MLSTSAIHYNVEIQCEVVYCYYDYENNERVVTSFEKANDKIVKYMYVEDGKIFIEYDNEE